MLIKRHHQDRCRMDKILAACKSDRRFVPRTHREFLQINNKGTTTQFKKNQRLDQTPYGRSNNIAYTYIKVSQHLNHQGNANYKHSRYDTKTRKVNGSKRWQRCGEDGTLRGCCDKCETVPSLWRTVYYKTKHVHFCVVAVSHTKRDLNCG